MAQECELLSTCGFFKKYQASQNLACQGFIKVYCRGPKIDQCKRKEYRRVHGQPPSDDMMPTGQMMTEEAHSV